MFGTALESKPTVDSMMIEADLISPAEYVAQACVHRCNHAGGIERTHHHKNTSEKTTASANQRVCGLLTLVRV
jgi:hypothetical protein